MLKEYKNISDKYKQLKLLGEGSFGKAFLVENLENRSLAVIKTIELTNMSEEEKQESIQEAKILENLNHPHIIRFREVFVEKKRGLCLSIVMDYAEGGDLQMRIKAQKGKFFSESQILDWFTQICLAVKHIHDKKILHRDIK
jgi:NIMA (never in mitosis gene a)-related kinase